MFKKRGFLLLILAVLLSWLGYTIASEVIASDRAVETISQFKNDGFVNVRGERRGYLDNETELTQRIKMYANQDYLAVVAGDNDMHAVKLTMKDRKGNLIMEGESSGKVSSLQCKPKKKDKYIFTIEVPQKGGYYHFSIVTK